MHDTSFNQLFSKNLDSLFNKDPISASNNLAAENEAQLKHKLPENARVPTGDEIREFKSWEIKYRTDNPKASEREVRRAVQRQFNIVVIDGQNYLP